MSQHQIVITVPIPKTDQNSQTTRIIEAGRRKKDVKKAQLACQRFFGTIESDECNNLELPWDSAIIHVKWFHPTRKLRDIWNIVGSLKGTVDGIVRSGILTDDDKLQPPTVERLVDKENPRVELYLTKGQRRFQGVIR